MNRSAITANLRSPWQGPQNGEVTAPVTMIVPGQLCGSNGCKHYSADVLRATADRWEGVPVTMGHPMGDDGMPISVQQAPQEVIGRVRNPQFTDGKLRAEIVVENEQARDQVQDILEVSTAMFTDDDVAGHVMDLAPDHLALLPDCQGACSWADGCGVRANADPMEEVGTSIHNVLCHEAGVTTMKTSVSTNESTLYEPGEAPGSEVLLPPGVNADGPTEDSILMPPAVQQARREAEQAERERSQNQSGSPDGGPEPLLPTSVG